MNTDAERRALLRAIHTNGAAQVRRLRFGVYTLPSASEPSVTYVVRGTGLRARDYTCTCPAGSHGRACWHRASVQLRKAQESAKAQARRLAQAQSA